MILEPALIIKHKIQRGWLETILAVFSIPQDIAVGWFPHEQRPVVNSYISQEKPLAGCRVPVAGKEVSRFRTMCRNDAYRKRDMEKKKNN